MPSLPSCERPRAGCQGPLVSVILPTHNRRDLLRESIQSVLAQTYQNFELIVIDDGSSDGTRELVQSVAPSARYVWQRPSGVAAARNRGLREAHGHLIAFQDSDDLWHAEKLARQVAVFRDRPDVGVVCTAERLIDEQGNVIGGQWKQLHSGQVTERLFESDFVVMPSAVVRRTVVDQVKEFDTRLRITSDYQFWLRASLVTRFAFLSEPLVDERCAPNRLTAAKAEGLLFQYHMLKHFYDELGGSKVVRPRVARYSLAKNAFRAGRALKREGDLVRARSLFRASLDHRFSVRTLWACLSVRSRGGHGQPRGSNTARGSFREMRT